MPVVAAHSRPRRFLGRLLALTVLALLVLCGTAVAACPPPPVSTPFSPWGDANSYFLIPGGSFEGTPDEVGWTLSGASLTAGNEPFYVNASTDTQSLTINGGGSATSPAFCVDDTMNNLRFFAQEVSGGSDLEVQALVEMPNGNEYTVALGDLADGSMPAWAPTAPLSGNTSGLDDGETVQVALRFTVPDSSGSWQIDDVYVDPWRTG